jgi:hypothetical protein
MNEEGSSAEPTMDERHFRDNDAQSASYSDQGTARAITPQGGCGTCGQSIATTEAAPSATARMPSYVYAVGKIEARFPNLAAEKEFAQATGRADTAGKTDQQTFYSVLSKRENRYLVRQLCWVLGIQGLDTYLLLPRDPTDMDLLVESVRHAYNPGDIDVVIGTRGPLALPTMCNGLVVPMLFFDQIYSFDQATLINSIPVPDADKTPQANFAPAAHELFHRIMQLTDNAGATDEHRALNYLAMRYPGIYAKAAEQFSLEFSLTGVEVRPSPLSSTRKIVDVIFVYTNRKTDFTDKFNVRVDVTEEFPFLVAKISPYYNR